MRNGRHHIPDAVLRLLDQARAVPERDRRAAAFGRQRFLAEARALETERHYGALARWLGFGGTAGRMAVRCAAALILLLMLAGGTSNLVRATQHALPGDALYPLKLATEDAVVTLTPNMESQLGLRLTYAERRLTEIETLLGQERYDDVEVATAAFEEQVRLGDAVLSSLAERAPEVAEEVEHAAKARSAHQHDVLSEIIDRAPEAALPGLTRALEASERAQERGRPDAVGPPHGEEEAPPNPSQYDGRSPSPAGSEESSPLEKQTGAPGQPPGQAEPSDEDRGRGHGVEGMPTGQERLSEQGRGRGHGVDGVPPGHEKRTPTPTTETDDGSEAEGKPTPDS